VTATSSRTVSDSTATATSCSSRRAPTSRLPRASRCDAKWGGLKGLFNEGLFVLKCSGTGDLWFHAYGAVHEVVLDGGDYVVDTGFVVAWDPTLDYRLEWGGRIRAFLFSDQLLLRFSGHGRVWVQTRSSRALASWVHPFRRVERRNTSNDD
jgi:uncharacterized protein (AIM24 family)